VGDFHAWSGDTDTLKVARDVRGAAKATLSHDAVIQHAVGLVAVVPARLADPYENREAMRHDLERNSAAIHSALEQLGVRVEMTVVVRAKPETARAGPTPGRAYLESLRSGPRRSADILHELEARLRQIPQVISRRSDGATSALSSLVDSGDVARYRDVAGSTTVPDVTIAIDGPRAPYSFAAYAVGRGMVGALITPA
jgi:hypothetical protein